MEDEPERSRQTRAAAEAALVRVAHHYGARPEFVVLGGLVPELLCSGSRFKHAGTTDVDVQVDLEIACGTVNAVRLERALQNAEFEPTTGRVWRWKTDDGRTVVKFELLADSDTVAAGAVAFVLQHNDAGGPRAACSSITQTSKARCCVRTRFSRSTSSTGPCFPDHDRTSP